MTGQLELKDQTCGLYILANNRCASHAIALTNSIRLFDKDIPISLIPYDKHYKELLLFLKKTHEVRLFENLDVVNKIQDSIIDVFGENFFKSPNRHRKYACWFGPFERFIYLDSDIVLQKSAKFIFPLLEKFDLVCCDDQHKTLNKYVFKDSIFTAKILDSSILPNIFNTGFWGSRKNILHFNDLMKHFDYCKSIVEHLDFSAGVNDMPILNLLAVNKHFSILNLMRNKQECCAWGHEHLEQYDISDDIVTKKNTGELPMYVHWAGCEIESKNNFYKVWKKFFDMSKNHSVESIENSLGSFYQLKRLIKLLLGKKLLALIKRSQ